MFEVKNDIFLQILEKFSENNLLINEKRIWKFREFFEESFHFSESLDIKPNEIVALPASNSEIVLKSLLALWFKRAIAVPLNSSLPVYKRKKLLKKVGCKERHIEGILGIFYKHFSENNSNNSYSIEEKKFLNLKFNKKKLLINSRAWGTIIFTSGSSGFEKAVVHSVGNHFYSALGSNEFEPLNPGDRWLLSLPLYHVGGIAIFFRILLSGAAMVSPSKKDKMGEIIKNYKITHLSLVPTQLYRLLKTKNGRDSLRKLKLILLGGGNIPMPLLKESSKLGLKLKVTYGSTEMASQVATGSKDAYRILPYREVRISKVSEIEVRGKTRFLGYYEKEKLIKPFNKNGWFKTGDLGNWSKKGKNIKNNNLYQKKFIKIFGRIDGMFISGGENIFPEEIENLMYKSEMVHQAKVVSVKDIEFGKRPVVFVKYVDGFSEFKLRNFLEKHLLKYKIPDLFLPWEETFENVLKHSNLELTKIAQDQFDIFIKKRT